MNNDALVGLFSSHANELRKAHRSLQRSARDDPVVTIQVARREAQPRISDEHARRIADGYSTGKTVYDLAKEMGCHRTTISLILKRQGIALRGASPTTEQADEMICLYRTGLSLAEVGKRLGFNASTVLNQLRLREVPTRSK